MLQWQPETTRIVYREKKHYQKQHKTRDQKQYNNYTKLKYNTAGNLVNIELLLKWYLTHFMILALQNVIIVSG